MILDISEPNIQASPIKYEGKLKINSKNMLNNEQILKIGLKKKKKLFNIVHNNLAIEEKHDKKSSNFCSNDLSNPSQSDFTKQFMLSPNDENSIPTPASFHFRENYSSIHGNRKILKNQSVITLPKTINSPKVLLIFENM